MWARLLPGCARGMMRQQLLFWERNDARLGVMRDLLKRTHAHAHVCRSCAAGGAAPAAPAY